jgi:hypothetical protein
VNRRRVRLGTGDFTSAKAANPHARWLFLMAVERCVPEALAALARVYGTDTAALDAWAQRWGFTDDWARRIASLHVTLWRENPTLAGRWQIVSAAVAWEPIPAAVSWNPVAETEAAFRERVNTYIAACKRNGLMPTPTKEDVRHFEWLALHHVAGDYPYQRIVERYQDADGSPDVSAVSRAMKQTAALVGITLRPTRGRKLSHNTRQ